MTPWDDRATELEKIEGLYCHYAAWLEWMAAECPDLVAVLQEAESDSDLIVELYCACEKIAEHASKGDTIYRMPEKAEGE